MKILIALLALVTLGGCGTSTCVTVSCRLSADESCFADTSAAECADFEASHLNGCSWSPSTNSCESLGFEYQCYGDQYTRSSSACTL